MLPAKTGISSPFQLLIQGISWGNIQIEPHETSPAGQHTGRCSQRTGAGIQLSGWVLSSGLSLQSQHPGCPLLPQTGHILSPDIRRASSWGTGYSAAPEPSMAANKRFLLSVACPHSVRDVLSRLNSPPPSRHSLCL